MVIGNINNLVIFSLVALESWRGCGEKMQIELPAKRKMELDRTLREWSCAGSKERSSVLLSVSCWLVAFCEVFSRVFFRVFFVVFPRGVSS